MRPDPASSCEQIYNDDAATSEIVVDEHGDRYAGGSRDKTVESFERTSKRLLLDTDASVTFGRIPADEKGAGGEFAEEPLDHFLQIGAAPAGCQRGDSVVDVPSDGRAGLRQRTRISLTSQRTSVAGRAVDGIPLTIPPALSLEASTQGLLWPCFGRARSAVVGRLPKVRSRA